MFTEYSERFMLKAACCLWESRGYCAKLAPPNPPTLSFLVLSSSAIEISFLNIKGASQAHSTFMETWNLTDISLECLSLLEVFIPILWQILRVKF